MPSARVDWAARATSWLGWNAETGQPVPHPVVSGLPLPLEDITLSPRRYGLHATMKPPFALAGGTSPGAVADALGAFCADRAPVRLDGLAVTRLGRFLALCPEGEHTALNRLAADCVSRFDGFRAPLSEAELERRRAAALTPAQEANLTRWGYPYVMEAFRFHITLSGRLKKDDLDPVGKVLRDLLTPELPRPFVLDSLALAGEDETGRFHLLHRYPLAGSGSDDAA